MDETVGELSSSNGLALVLNQVVANFTPTPTADHLSTMPSDVVTPISLWMQVLICIACGLSIIGSLLIIVTYIIWPEIRTVSRSLLVYLSIADLLLAVGYLEGGIRNVQDNTWDCIAQSAVTTFANTSSFFWTISIAVFLHITIVHMDTELAQRCIKYFHIISWGVPFIITVTALSLQKLGYDNSDISVGWCWINVFQHDFVLWMVLTVKGWEILTYIILPTLYLHIKWHLYKQQQSHLNNLVSINYTPDEDLDSSSQYIQNALEAMLKVNRKLTFIPVAFLFLRMWSTIRFVLYIAGSLAVCNNILVTLHGIGNCSQGAVNCMLFCLSTDNIRNKLGLTLKRYLCYCKRHGSLEEQGPLLTS